MLGVKVTGFEPSSWAPSSLMRSKLGVIEWGRASGIMAPGLAKGSGNEVGS
jgi:hypothetical protein